MKISYRLGPEQWECDHRFKDTLGIIKKYKDNIDEIQLFIAKSYNLMELDEIERQAKIGIERINVFRDLGLKSGYNFLCTLGHIGSDPNFDKDHYFDYFVDWIDSPVKVVCPRSPKTYQYNEKAYSCLAKYNPDFIWIDDDLRLIWHSPGFYGCFCPICMKEFSEKIGMTLDKDTFKEITKGDSPEAMAIRKKWIEFNGESLINLDRHIRRVVDKINPNIELGQMSPDYNYSLNAYKGISDVLSRDGEINAKWRPGGFYNRDIDKTKLLFKGVYIGKQIGNYPTYIKDIQAEVENDPDIQVQKASYSVALESCMDIGLGSTGIAYNVMSPGNNKIKFSMAEANETRYRDILKYRPFYEKLASEFKRNDTRGVYLNNWNTDHTLSLNMDSGKYWLDDEPHIMNFEFFELGIPMSYNKQTSPVTMLYDENVYGMEKEEIMDMLSKGVFMDAKSLSILNKLGYGEWTGFEINNEIKGAHEYFLNHPLNGDYEHYIRYNTVNDKNFSIRKTNDKAQYLCAYTKDFENPFEILGQLQYGMGVFENSLGGRICVNGFQYDKDIGTFHKTFQLKNVIKYLSRNSVAFVKTFGDIIVYDRSDEKAKLLLINNSFDNLENMEIAVPMDVHKVKTLDMDMKENVFDRILYKDGYSYFKVGNMNRFTPLLVVSV